jgi:hypothetical protein
MTLAFVIKTSNIIEDIDNDNLIDIYNDDK